MNPNENDVATAQTNSAPTRLIDQNHYTDSATFKAIQAAKTHGKDYDAYLMAMLTDKVPARQAELLYKKIGSELGFILSTNQKKEMAKAMFLSNDLTTQDGVDAVLAVLPEKIGLTKGGVKGWMKNFAKAKGLVLAKASIAVAGPSTRTLEIFEFIKRGHEAKKDRKTILEAVSAKYELKESTAAIRYATVAREEGWNINPADTALKDWAVFNARTGTKDEVSKLHPNATKAATKQVISALAFFQAVMAMEDSRPVAESDAVA